MAKGDQLVIDNVNEILEGIHCDADRNELTVDTMCVSANDMMRVCGGCGLVRMVPARIAGVSVLVLGKDMKALEKAGIALSGRNSLTVEGKVKEDDIFGSCMLLGYENSRMRSLTRSESKRILATAKGMQFTSEGGRTCLCLTGLEMAR